MSKSTELNKLRITYRQAMKALAGTKGKLISNIRENKVDISDLVEEYNAQVEALLHFQDLIKDTIRNK